MRQVVSARPSLASELPTATRRDVGRPLAVSPTPDHPAAVDLLLQHQIHHLPVVNLDNRLVGVVSSIDLVDYLRLYMLESEQQDNVTA